MVLTLTFGYAARIQQQTQQLQAPPLLLRDQTPSELAGEVAFAVEAVKNYKGLRCAPINSANRKPVRCALDCLPRYGWEGI